MSAHHAVLSACLMLVGGWMNCEGDADCDACIGRVCAKCGYVATNVADQDGDGEADAVREAIKCNAICSLGNTVPTSCVLISVVLCWHWLPITLAFIFFSICTMYLLWQYQSTDAIVRVRFATSAAPTFFMFAVKGKECYIKLTDEPSGSFSNRLYNTSCMLLNTRQQWLPQRTTTPGGAQVSLSLLAGSGLHSLFSTWNHVSEQWEPFWAAGG